MFMFALLFGMAINAQAQVCKIKGSATNDNVEVYSYVLSEDKSAVTVTVGNDSQDISANVTIAISVTYISTGGTKKKMNFSGKGLAKPNSATDIKIPVTSIPNFSIQTIEVVSITGTKCE